MAKIGAIVRQERYFCKGRNHRNPVFGMVCAKHKDVAKAKIKKFRDARKAKRAKAA